MWGLSIFRLRAKQAYVQACINAIWNLDITGTDPYRAQIHTGRGSINGTDPTLKYKGVRET